MSTHRAEGAFIRTRTEAERAPAHAPRLTYRSIRVKGTEIGAKTY